MTQLDPTLGTASLPKAQATAAAAPAASGASASGFTFHDFLSIINPLQHIPVIGTLYRAITGDKIGVPEKIAGDALYGGLWGAVSSAADAAFEAVTGKDFGDTVLSFLTGSHGATTAVAGNAPASTASTISPSISPASGTPSSADIAAQVASLNAAMPVLAAPVSATATTVSANSPAPGQNTNSDFLALAASLSQKGVDGTLVQRALYAYQKSMTLPASAFSSTLVPAQ